MAIEIVSFPIKNCVFPAFFVNVYQRVIPMTVHMIVEPVRPWSHFPHCIAAKCGPVLLGEYTDREQFACKTLSR